MIIDSRIGGSIFGSSGMKVSQLAAAPNYGVLSLLQQPE